jgi:small subunit ribosomal protein S4
MAFTAKDAKILQKRNYAPGQHGQGRKRSSEFGVQLKEKQKAKVMYGVTEKQFSKYFLKALRQTGVTGENLLKQLELRLDNVVYRGGFGETRAQARQLVGHGFVEVNGKPVNIPSYSVKIGDTIKIRPSKQKSAYVEKLKEKLKGFKAQEWVQVDTQGLSIKPLTAPTSELIDNTINTQLIVEHYSRT